MAQKKEIPGAVTDLGNRTFLVHAVAASEEAVTLHFDGNLPPGYRVIKLDSTRLPTTHGGQPIAWVNHWGIKNASNRWAGKAENVGHIAFFKASTAGKRLVYVDGGDVRDDRMPVGAGPGMVKVGFETGDPATGWM